MTYPSSFGSLLRAARQRAGLRTQSAFADFLSAHSLTYSTEAIGHWETDRRVPSREMVLRVLAALAQAGGITTLAEVRAMLWALGWRALSAEEQAAHFPALAAVDMPVNLPPRPYDRLVGRDSIVTALVAHLSDPHARSVVAISGLGGIGKTALAWDVARQGMAAGLFEALAWVSAKSEDFTGVTIRQRARQQVHLHSIVTDIAAQVGLSGVESLTPPQVAARLRSYLRQQPALVVLDNLESLEAAREVAQSLHDLVSPAAGPRPSKVLISSRERLVDEAYIYDEYVRGLAEPDALALLEFEARTRGAVSLLAADDALRHRAYTVTGGMPLALKLVVSQCLLGIPLDAELERLTRATDEEQLYRFIYFALWEKLSLNAQKVLVGAATFPVSGQRAHLISLSQMDEATFDPAATELVRASLLDVLPQPGQIAPRYAVHAMTRWFVNAPLTELWNQQRGQQP